MTSNHSSEIPSHDPKHKIVVISLIEKYMYKMGVDQLLVETCVNESVIHVNYGLF